MTQLVYSKEEILEPTEVASPQIEAGHRLHGGFDAAGNYLPPRMKHRGPAFAAWEQALEARGGELMDADSSLLAGIRFPSLAQHKPTWIVIAPSPPSMADAGIGMSRTEKSSTITAWRS